MSPTVLAFGFLAGATILLGPPVARLRNPSVTLRVALYAGAVGVLLFLVWDVLSAAWEPIDTGLTARTLPGSFWMFAALFLVGLGVGLLGLAQFERRWMRRTARTELPPRRLALLIAIVIGFALHTATEGFGIVSPLTDDENRPSWKFLLLLGLIGGGPTLIGTLVGSLFVSETAGILVGMVAGFAIDAILRAGGA